MSYDNFSKNNEPRIGKTIRNDFHQVKMKDTLGGEYKDLKEYFLSDERKEKLKLMGRFKKFFVIPWWLLKSLYFKLTPFRRLILVAGIILLFITSSSDSGSNGLVINSDFTKLLSGIIFLFIIALELKDKLHAKTELEEGRAVQNALMPKTNPAVAGWDIWLYTKPANDVGGDLLDFLKLSEDKVSISVGDVAGKGLSAALLMAKLQSTIRAIVPEYNSIKELGEKINKIFYRDSLPRLFASLIYLELNIQTGKVKILNAGHLPPILIRKNNIERLKVKSPALGLIPDAIYKEETIDLHSQDILIIYSDGLTEARNEMGEFYTEKRLEQFLSNISNTSSEILGEKVLDEISTFIGKAKIHDDLTIAIIKRN